MDRVSRRSFMEKAGIAFGSLSQASSGKAGLPSGEAAKGSEGKDVVRYGVERFVVEWAYSSGKAYSDPFNDLELDVVFTDPHGNEQRVPAFWAGEQVWRIRYSPATTGRYTYRTISSDTTNADLRIQYLVERGLVPCIVACWGYFLPLMGIKKMKTHWRNLIARWGAYPVVWCLAGEGAMPFYLSKTKTEDAATQRRSWTEVGRYVRSVDPYHHPITIHPTDNARNQVEDVSVLDFDMLQTGHSDRKSIPNTVNQVTGSLLRSPRMPVLVGEVCYEGILEASRQEVERFMMLQARGRRLSRPRLRIGLW